MNEKFKKKYLKYKKKYLNIQKYMVGGSDPDECKRPSHEIYGISNIRLFWPDDPRLVDPYYNKLSACGFTVEMLKARRMFDIISVPLPPSGVPFIFGAPPPTISKHLEDCDRIFNEHVSNKTYTIDLLEGGDVEEGDIKIRAKDWIVPPPPGGVPPTEWTKTYPIPVRDNLVKMAILDTFKDIEEEGKMDENQKDIFQDLLPEIFYTTKDNVEKFYDTPYAHKTQLKSMFNEIWQQKEGDSDYIPITDEITTSRRNFIKSEVVNYFFESGKAPEKLAAEPQISSSGDPNWLSFCTPAQNADEGPGGGKRSESFFPNHNCEILFKENFFKRIGFQNIIKWRAKTWVTDSSRSVNDGGGHFIFEVIVLDFDRRSEINLTFDNIQVSNPIKKQLLERISAMRPDLLDIHPKLLLRTYIEFKELGDTMQSFLFLVALIEETNNINFNNSIFSTGDQTPFYRNVEMGLPSCYIGGPNTDTDNKVIKPLMYYPPSDPIKRLLNELFVTSMNVINVLSIALNTISKALVTSPADFYITTTDAEQLKLLELDGFTHVTNRSKRMKFTVGREERLESEFEKVFNLGTNCMPVSGSGAGTNNAKKRKLRIKHKIAKTFFIVITLFIEIAKTKKETLEHKIKSLKIDAWQEIYREAYDDAMKTSTVPPIIANKTAYIAAENETKDKLEEEMAKMRVLIRNYGNQYLIPAEVVEKIGPHDKYYGCKIFPYNGGDWEMGDVWNTVFSDLYGRNELKPVVDSLNEKIKKNQNVQNPTTPIEREYWLNKTFIPTLASHKPKKGTYTTWSDSLGEGHFGGRDSSLDGQQHFSVFHRLPLGAVESKMSLIDQSKPTSSSSSSPLFQNVSPGPHLMGMPARNTYFVELLAETHFIKKNLYKNAFDGVPLSEKQAETNSLQYKEAKEAIEETHGLLNKAQESLTNAVKDGEEEVLLPKKTQDKTKKTAFTEELGKVAAAVGEAKEKVGEAKVLLVEAFNANQQFVLSVIETICFIYYFYKNCNILTWQLSNLPDLDEVLKHNDKYKKQKTEWTKLYEERKKTMEELAKTYVELDKVPASDIKLNPNPNPFYNRAESHLPSDKQKTTEEKEMMKSEEYINELNNQISTIQYEYSDEFINDLFFKCLNYTLVLQDFNNLIKNLDIELLKGIQDPVIRLLKAILTVCKEKFEDDFIEIVCNILQHIYSEDPTYKDFDFNQIWVPNYVEKWWDEKFKNSISFSH